MHHETNKSYDLVITDSCENFDTWINRPYIPETLKQELKNASILITPIEGFRGKDIRVFPDQTEELFVFIKNRLPPDYEIDICVADQDYKELTLYADLLMMGSLVVSAIALPILLDILSEYIKKKIFRTGRRRGVKVELTIVDESGKSKSLTYEGEPENFGVVINQLKSSGKAET